MSADALHRKQLALDAIVVRVRREAGSWLRASETIQIAIACGTRAPEELLGVLINDKAARNAKNNASALAITNDEWVALYGIEAIEVHSTLLADLSRQITFKQAVKAVNTALRTTIAEQSQGAAWMRPMTQAAVYTAFHMTDDELLIAASLGSVVRADSRRMRDIIDQIDDEGADPMLLARAIVALASAVTS